jgi:UDP-N-acetyl-D-glucosamine/UDP-N-acetyl-D-galactosamine dehydrogenase
MISYKDLLEKRDKICVVGLGYVGLPLAILLAKKFDVIGFDIDQKKIEELVKGHDRTGEVPDNDLLKSTITYTAKGDDIRECRYIIIAVPTPIDDNCIPDLSILESASVCVGKYMQDGSIVVYESTVYPGATEEVCLPILQKESNLKYNEQFYIGYSPERVNPGDKEHTIDTIVKVVSGSTAQALEVISQVYGTITKIHTAPTIRVAEAAKIIENTQRDINIALMNELSMIFHKMDIDTKEVLAAAGTKWNFLPFTPGLVGGHCIGVDPYYLTYKAAQLGHEAKTILAGREINDSMPYVVAEYIKDYIKQLDVRDNTVRVQGWGITFKENVPDVRNAKIAIVYQELKKLGVSLHIQDSLADIHEVKKEYDISIRHTFDSDPADILIIGVAHKQYLDMTIDDVSNHIKPGGLIVDIKGLYNKEHVISKGYSYWRL